jgi:acetyltransferase-like isoleucine patch superfamily enzyme/acyl carrier protein
LNTSNSPQPNRRTPTEIAAIVRSFARARFELRGTKLGPRVRCYGSLDVPRRQGIVIGQQVNFLGGPVPTSLRCGPGAEIVIGDRTICNYGAGLKASRSVRIGTDCMLASHVYISDDDGRRSAPIQIGNGVWIAYGAVIMPGAVIGDGAVIATHAVVSGVVPAGSLAAGNPATLLPLEPTGPEPASPEAPVDAAGLPSPADVRAAILEWLDDTRCFGDAATRVASDTMSLRDAGLLDSLGIVELILMLEKRFDVVIDRNRAARSRVQSIQGFIDCILPVRDKVTE